jgi:D-lactate dehydrogenase (quinone)
LRFLCRRARAHSQIRKGPVYTERLLYARVGADGRVEVVDTLGLDWGSGGGGERPCASRPSGPSLDRAAAFARLEAGAVTASVAGEGRPASAAAPYASSVCDAACGCESSGGGGGGGEVARWNADVRGPEPVRSEGKVLVLASVHDTFPKPVAAKALWVSVDSLATAAALKRAVCLGGGAGDLPVSCE